MKISRGTFGFVAVALVVTGCVAQSEPQSGPTRPGTSAVAEPSPLSDPLPEATADGVPVLDLAHGDFPDAIEAGVLEVLVEDAGWGLLEPDGSYLVEDWDPEGGGTRIGRLDLSTGETQWFAELPDGGDSWWFTVVGSSGDHVVWTRAWNEKGHKDYSLGVVYLHDAASGTTLDLTQSEPGPARHGTQAAVVGDRVYWTEGGESPLYARELADDAPVHELLADAYLEVDECVAANEGRTELLVSGANEDGEYGSYRLGVSGELVERGPNDPDPDRRTSGSGAFECAGATATTVDRDDDSAKLDDPENRERLELVEPGRVTHFLSDESSNISLDALTANWLVLHLFNGAEADGFTFAYDRAGAQLYRLPVFPGTPGGSVALGGDILRFGVDEDLEDYAGGARRFALGQLTPLSS